MTKDIKLIEGVQQQATKLVQGIGNLKYAEWLILKNLGPTELEKMNTKVRLHQSQLTLTIS